MTLIPLPIHVVDNEPAIPQLLTSALSPGGFLVTVATDGREALRLFEEAGGGIDLVLLDVWMPGMDGPQTLAALRKIDPAVCCFMTTRVGKHSRDESQAMGAAEVFGKPFAGLDDLARGLLAAVGEARVARRGTRPRGP